MNKRVLILAAHQSHVGSKAGGYIRLKEFLKYLPQEIDALVIDLEPTIYADELKSSKIVSFPLPQFIHWLVGHFSALGILFERIYVAFRTYSIAKKIVSSNEIRIIYVPIGEFLHLYLPAIFLKRRYPHLKLVVDILNFQIYKKGFIHTLKKYVSKSNNTAIGLATGLISYLSFKVVQKTISYVDYIFTVSPELVETIKFVYKKDSINYTPSGVNSSAIQIGRGKKKYLGVYIGRVTEQKGIFNLLDTWQVICKTRPDAKLAIAGLISADVLQVINEKIQSMGLQKNIYVIGEITEQEKVKIISESEIFLHLANYEPLFPVIGILEGLAGGLPVILYDMKVTRPIIKKVRNNDILYVVKNGDIKAAAKEVEKIYMKDVQQKKLIQKNAREYALKFDWKEISKIEFSVIKSLDNEK